MDDMVCNGPDHRYHGTIMSGNVCIECGEPVDQTDDEDDED